MSVSISVPLAVSCEMRMKKKFFQKLLYFANVIKSRLKTASLVRLSEIYVLYFAVLRNSELIVGYSIVHLRLLSLRKLCSYSFTLQQMY